MTHYLNRKGFMAIRKEGKLPPRISQTWEPLPLRFREASHGPRTGAE